MKRPDDAVAVNIAAADLQVIGSSRRPGMKQAHAVPQSSLWFLPLASRRL
jgi:hypothetical protein